MSFRDNKRKKVKKTEAPSIGDTAEKLRLIRERQSKWMKERDEARSTESSSSKRSSSNSPCSSMLTKSLSQEAIQMKLPYSSRSSTANSNPRRKPLYPEPKTDRSNVITWTTKNDCKVSKRPPSGHNRTQSAASADVNYLVGSKSVSKTSKTYKPSNYFNSMATSNAATKTDASLRPGSSKRIHAKDGIAKTESDSAINIERELHRTFKEFSEKSENKNKEKPSYFETHSNKGNELPENILDALAVTVAEKLRTIPSGKNNNFKASEKMEKEPGMSSHYCNVCKELMTSPTHTPTAAVPCGHTCCKVCILESQKCPTCNTRIVSTAVNTVLENIIAGFRAEKERERLQKLEQETRKYVEEYQSLTFRCEALTGEAETILGNMESITNDLVEEKKAIKRLDTEKKQMEQKIQQLQGQLEENNSLKEKRQEICVDLERKYGEEQDRLAMAEDTVRTIQKTKDKIKLLVQNLAPSLDLDKFSS